MSEVQFLLGSVIFAIVLGCVIYFYESAKNELKEEKAKYKRFYDLKIIHNKIFVGVVERKNNQLMNKQLIIEALRKDMEGLLEISKEDRLKFLRESGQWETSVQFGNDYINKLHNSVYYHPELNEIILLTDLTNLGEL